MKTRAKVYVGTSSGLGVCCTLGCVAVFLRDFLANGSLAEALLLAAMVAVCAVCRSLPLHFRQNQTLDVSIISILGVYLTQGACAAVTVYTLSSLFTFEFNTSTKKYVHSFSIGMKIVLFNNATIVLSILLPAALLWPMSWQPGMLSLPAALLPTVLFSFLTFAINGLLQLTRPCLDGQVHLDEMGGMLLGLLPNVIAAMPVGYILAIGYSTPNNMWFVVLMMLPLLLARYAWKLYLDSQNAQSRLITAFIHSLEAKDRYTQGHSARVADYCVEIAQQMQFPPGKLRLLRQGALLHDIGKIGVADTILNKPGKLTNEEFEAIHQHPLIGVTILSDVGLSPEVLEMVRSHHERYDGKGYPDGVRSSELSLMTRILCVADAYDAMTSDRPYRQRLPHEEAIRRLQEGAGTQFDPAVVEAMVKAEHAKN